MFLKIGSLIAILVGLWQQPPVVPPAPEPPAVVIEEPIRVIAPEVVPDRMPADITVEVAGDATALVYVFEATSSLDVDVTDTATREGLAANTWHLYGRPGLYRVFAFAYVDEKPVSATAEIRVGGDVSVPIVEPPPGPTEPTDPSTFNELKIVGPIEPIKRPQQVTLKVFGLTEAELPQASVHVLPELDYTAVKTWTGETVILVPITSETKAGQYTFAVSLNHWRTEVEDGFDAALAARVPQDLLSEYAALVKKFEERFPHKSATCVLDVAMGPVVPDPPTDPPLPPTTKVTRVTYVFEKDLKNTPRAVALALNRLNAMGILATEFEEDSLDGSGEVPDQYKIALAEARKAGLPALVVESNGTVLRVIKDPTTEAAVLEAAR